MEANFASDCTSPRMSSNHGRREQSAAPLQGRGARRTKAFGLAKPCYGCLLLCGASHEPSLLIFFIFYTFHPLHLRKYL